MNSFSMCKSEIDLNIIRLTFAFSAQVEKSDILFICTESWEEAGIEFISMHHVTKNLIFNFYDTNVSFQVRISYTEWGKKVVSSKV